MQSVKSHMENSTTIPLLLLSHFSRVRLCVTPETSAHEAPPSLGFSGKNTGVGCHCLLQCRKVKSESEVAQLYPTLSDPMDCSPPGSSVHGILQARVLEWGAIAFSTDRVGIHIYTLISKLYQSSWRRQWHPTPVLLPGESHGCRSLEGCSPWGR